MEEKDFLGLVVKKETHDEISDLAPARSLAMQWSSSSKASALPQLLSFNSFHDEKPKTGFGSLASNGLVSITRTKAFDSDKKQYSGVVQKNIVPENQGRYPTSTYPVNLLDSPTVHHPLNRQTNVAVTPAVSAIVNQSLISTAGLYLVSSASPQPLAGIPMANPIQAVHSSCSIAGNTDLRNAPNISTAPAQMTLFYAGSVCVYDNISPEKAQAIMLLAGNMAPVTNSTFMPGSSGIDGFVPSQNYGTTLHCKNTMPVTISLSRGNNTTAVRPAGVPTLSSNTLDVVNSSTFLSSNTVPQSRRKSLARFLEKRKERLIASKPYVGTQPVDCSTPGAGSTSLPVNSSGSSPLPDII